MDEDAPPRVGDTLMFGRTPLHLAARSGDIESAERLLEKADDRELIGTPDDHGFTPLYHTAMFGNVAVMSLLLRRGADIQKADLGGLSPLHIACEKGRAEAAVVLLENGADLHASDSIGREPKAWAEAKGHVNVLAAIRDWQGARERRLLDAADGAT